MSNRPAATLLCHVRNLMIERGIQGLPDQELVGRFAADADQAAFESLLRRHGPMVLAVCRRLLRHEQDAEDAFQATFLLLARKAGRLRSPATVGCWLYGTAYRLALKTREKAARRTSCERQARPPAAAPDPLAKITVREAQAAVDEELARLPERYRAPLILCCLEGATRDEAAQHLSLSAGSLKSRLERGRRLLSQRLAGRGLTLPAALLALGLAERSTRAVLPDALVGVTIRAAQAVAAGGMGAATLPPRVAFLAGAANRAPAPAAWKVVTVLLGLALAGAGLTLYRAPAEKPSAIRETSPLLPSTPEAPRADRHGDLLPPGALLRLGTLRFRHDTRVHSAAVSPDGKVIAAGGSGRVVLWDAATGKQLRLLELPPGGVTPLAFSPDGRALATGSGDNLVRLWDAASGKLLRQLVGHEGPPDPRYYTLPGLYHIAFSPDGKTLASRGSDRTVRLWEVATGRQLHRFDAPPFLTVGPLGTLAISPDGKTLVVGGGADKGGEIIVWDTATGKERRRWEFASAVASLALSPDGKTIATGAADPTKGVAITLWAADTGREVRRLNLPAPGPRGRVHRGPVMVAFSSDGKTLASPDADTLRRWDAASGEELRPIEAQVHSLGVAFLDGDKVLMSWGGTHTVHLWAADTGKPLRRFAGPEGQLHDVAFSPDGKVVATAGGSDSGVRLWDAASGKEVGPLAGGNTALAFSPDGQVLAAASFNGVVWLWQPATRKLLHWLDGHKPGDTIRIAFAPDGKRLASADGDRVLRLWDASSGEEVRRWRWASNSPISSLAFSPDGKALVAGVSDVRGDGRENPLRAWDTTTGEERQLFQQRDRSGVTALTFTADGRVLASAHTDDTVRLWELSTGQERFRIKHPNHVTAIAVSRDGQLLASSNGDWTASRGPMDPGNAGWEVIRLWDLFTGKELHRFAGHRARATALAFSPDSKRLVSCSNDTTALIWEFQALRKEKRPVAGQLSREELLGLWKELSGPDGARAYVALGRMVAAPGQSVPFLKQHFAPAGTGDPARTAQLMADLDHNAFAVRERAVRELERLGPAVEPALRKALERRPGPEVRRRIEELLLRLTSGRLADRRAIEVLEHIGNTEARELLRLLAEGASQFSRTQEAKGALARLRARTAE